MDTTILQVPISKTLRNQAASVAQRHGFSSLQEAVRVFLRQFASKQVGITFSDNVRLSAKNEKRYLKMIKDVQSGKVKTKSFTSVDDMMKYLSA